MNIWDVTYANHCGYQPKSGSGKTTLALHLAVASSATGQNAALIDLDPQASAAKWADRREAELPVVLSAHASRLPNEIKRIQDAGCKLYFWILRRTPTAQP